MPMRLIAFLVLSFSMLLPSCATMQEGLVKGDKQPAVAIEKLGAVPEGLDGTAPRDLTQFKVKSVDSTIRPGDTAYVEVFGFEKLSDSYIVNGKGSLVIPLLGDVAVVGLTRLGLQSKLTRLYKSDFLQDPIINVRLKSDSLGAIIVSGAVHGPGIFEIDNLVTVGTAVAMAKGLTDDALSEELYVIRDEAGKRTVYTVDLSGIQIRGEPDPQILPGDYIFVRNDDSIDFYAELLKSLPLISMLAFTAR